MSPRTQQKDQRKECPVCRKMLHQSSFTAHMRIHTGERPFKCNECGKSFTQKKGLEAHQNIHTGFSPVKCDICGKGCPSKYHLILHMRTHTGERPLVCSHCEMRFSQRSALVNHVRTHTDERPYHCQHCDKTFRRQTHCKEHERSHTREKNYVCGICSKSFHRSSHLKEHAKTHNGGVQTLGCHLCPMTFSRTFCFTRHVARCQVRARANLIEDGMDPDETFLAVQIPEGMKKRTTAASAGGNKGRPWKNQGNRILREERLGGHDHSKLKACSVYLKRLTYLENAVEKGCRSMVMQQYNKPRLVL